MNPYVIVIIVLVALGLIGFGAYYYITRHRKPRSPEDDYIWVGQGEHPLKKKEE